jgi:hypothetical protein
MAKFIAYPLAAAEREAAEQEARKYLEQNPIIIEVWSDEHRRVARIVRT